MHKPRHIDTRRDLIRKRLVRRSKPSRWPQVRIATFNMVNPESLPFDNFRRAW